MGKLTVELLEKYLGETYKDATDDQSFFMKLVEEIGEVAELMNIRTGRKNENRDIKAELANELADVIHYTVAIAAINDIDLEKTIIEKDEKAAVKYHHKINLKDYITAQQCMAEWKR